MVLVSGGTYYSSSREGGQSLAKLTSSWTFSSSVKAIFKLRSTIRSLGLAKASVGESPITFDEAETSSEVKKAEWHLECGRCRRPSQASKFSAPSGLGSPGAEPTGLHYHRQYHLRDFHVAGGTSRQHFVFQHLFFVVDTTFIFVGITFFQYHRQDFRQGRVRKPFGWGWTR